MDVLFFSSVSGDGFVGQLPRRIKVFIVDCIGDDPLLRITTIFSRHNNSMAVYSEITIRYHLHHAGEAGRLLNF